MGSAFIMTEDDQRPENPSAAEDTLELRLLTAAPGTGPADVSQDEHPLDE
ncbi:hypothetical protein [Pseudarthrobacter albicanus]|nr:hypothetical protein [Pseudarthrobacter albicanus]